MHPIKIVYDGVEGVTKMYKDNLLVKTSYTKEYGDISNPKLWDRVLTEQEIKEDS